MTKKRKGANVLVQEAELIMGVPDFRDSVDKEDLPIGFLLKRGRARADAKVRKQSAAVAKKRTATSKKKKR
jgi:hypothetical protein